MIGCFIFFFSTRSFLLLTHSLVLSTFHVVRLGVVCIVEIALIVLLGWRLVRVVHSATDMVQKLYIRTHEFMDDSQKIGRETALATMRNRALVNTIETTAQSLRRSWALGDSEDAITVQIDVQSVNLKVLERASDPGEFYLPLHFVRILLTI